MPSTADQDPYDLDDMVKELAFRMFTDLALSGSVRWRATSTFSEGLRFYRDCLRTPEGRRLKLKQAEKKFIETLGEDREFASANYNLGVLYMELNQVQAAEEAFQRAISQNPSSWRGYYALAVCRSKRSQYESVKSLCELVVEPVITRKPGIANIAKVYHSWGLAQCGLVHQNLPLFHDIGKQRQDQQGEVETFQSQNNTLQYDKISELNKIILNLDEAIPDEAILNLDEAIRRYKKAVTFSWRALCSAELFKKGVTKTENRVIPQRESVASVCQIDLAIAYGEQAMIWREIASQRRQSKSKKQQRNASKHALFAFGRAKTLFKSAEVLFHYATFLTPSNTKTYEDLVTQYTDNYFNIASMFYDWRKYDEAIERYRSALHINPEDSQCWAYLALAYVKVSETQKIRLPTAAKINERQAKDACKKALSYLSSASPDTLKDILERIKNTYHELGNKRSRDIAQDMMDLLEKYDKLIGIADRGSVHERQECILSIVHLVEQLSHSTEEEQTWKRVLDWVCIQVYPVLGILSLASDRAEEAERHIKKAIGLLKEIQEQGLQIQVQGLRAVLVYALLSQKKHDEALQEAKQALVSAPHSYIEWEALGDAHFTLNQFADAIEAWQEAISRRYAFMPDLSTLDTSIIYLKLGVSFPMKYAHDIPFKNIPYKIGISYRELAKYTHDLTKRSDALKQAVNYIEQAQSIYEGEQQNEKRSIYYFLGFLHFELGEYHDAISYLQISQSSQSMRLTSLFYLGYAYLKNKDYDAALKQFNLLHQEAKKKEGADPLSTLIEAEDGGFMSLGEILAMGLWGIAFTNAERNTCQQKDLDLVEKAQHYMDELDELESPVHFKAYCKDCKGWILYKMDKIDEAISYLKQAVSLSSNPEGYLHLALAYEKKLQASEDNAYLLQEIQVCCQNVQELDIRKEYEQQVSTILRRHQEKSK